MEFARRVGRIVDELHGRSKMPKIYLLDEDFDASDPAQFNWAIATRVHPTDRIIVRQGPILSMLTCYSDDERKNGYGALAIRPRAGMGG